MSDITYRCAGCLTALASHAAFEEHAKTCEALKDWLAANKPTKETSK